MDKSALNFLLDSFLDEFEKNLKENLEKELNKKQFSLPRNEVKYFQNKYIPAGVGKRVIADFD